MEKILTVNDVAAILQVKAITVREMFREKRLRGFKVGKAWRTTESMLQEDISALARGESPAELPTPDVQRSSATPSATPVAPPPVTPPPATAPPATTPEKSAAPVASATPAPSAPRETPKRKPAARPAPVTQPASEQDDEDTQQMLF